MSVNEKMTALADEIRELSGTTSKKGLDAMASDVNAANTEIGSQVDLIAQLAAVVNNLPTAGGTPVLQDKTVTPTTSTQTVTADAGYDGLDTVTVNAMPTATQATPSISVSTSGLITASATQTAGYVSAGTKSATKQLTTQAAKTITPSTSSQTAVSSGVYTTGTVTVSAIPSTYVKPTTTKSATTYTPSTSDQTIASGTYCSGTQTIKGDSNLVASNIKSGVSIFGVSGSYEGASSGGGSGGGLETCTVTIKGNSPMGTEGVLYYSSGYPTCEETLDTGPVTVVKNSIIVAQGFGSLPSLQSGSAFPLLLASTDMVVVWFVTGDCTIKL